MTTPDFYNWLRSEAPDLESAKEFVRRWSAGTHWLSYGPQGIMTEAGGQIDITQRAMAYHMSCALEGKLDDPLKGLHLTDYRATEFGYVLARVMWTKKC